MSTNTFEQVFSHKLEDEIHRNLFANKANGDFDRYLNSVFGFLRKETDFFKRSPEANEENAAAGMVKKAFEKHLAIHNRDLEVAREYGLVSMDISERKDPRFAEYRLSKKPESLQTILDISSKLESRHFLIHIVDDAFIKVEGHRAFYDIDDDDPPQDYFTFRLTVSTYPWVRICGTTEYAAGRALNYLFSLPLELASDYFELRAVTENVALEHLSVDHLRDFTMIANPSATISFSKLMFSRDHGRVLGMVCARSARRAIFFLECDFSDKGASFIDGLLASSGTLPNTSGSECLSFRGRLPFDDRNWERLMSALPCNLMLNLAFVNIGSVKVPAPDIRSLQINYCESNGGSIALTEALKSNRGPANLCIADLPVVLGGRDKILPFVRALGHNTHLKSLTIQHSLSLWPDAVGQALADSLSTNQGLRSLTLNLRFERKELWTDVISSMANHPSLTDIRLYTFNSHFDYKENELQQRVKTNAVINLLQSNERIELFYTFRTNFGYTDKRWDSEVKPRLEINRFRKKLRIFHQETLPSDQAPLLPHAMERVSLKPSLLWLALQQHRDLVLQSIGELVESSQSATDGPPRQSRRLLPPADEC